MHLCCSNSFLSHTKYNIKTAQQVPILKNNNERVEASQKVRVSPTNCNSYLILSLGPADRTRGIFNQQALGIKH